jgi:hypothetical protein
MGRSQPIFRRVEGKSPNRAGGKEAQRVGTGGIPAILGESPQFPKGVNRIGNHQQLRLLVKSQPRGDGTFPLQELFLTLVPIP